MAEEGGLEVIAKAIKSLTESVKNLLEGMKRLDQRVRRLEDERQSGQGTQNGS